MEKELKEKYGDDFENIRPCEVCGEPASFESGDGTPREGDVCTGCGIWLCHKCSKYGSIGVSPFCGECFKLKEMS